MSDEWKYKELPRASGKIAPAQWNPDTEEWEVFTGLSKVEDVAVEARLESIEQTQILAKLNDTIDTRLTGSIDEYALPVKDDELIAAVERGGLVAFDQNLVTGVGAIRIWTGTLNEYDSIENKDDDVIYMVRG